MVVVHEGTMRTECSLRTYEPDDPLDLQFRLGAQPTKLTINAVSQVGVFFFFFSFLLKPRILFTMLSRNWMPVLLMSPFRWMLDTFV